MIKEIDINNVSLIKLERWHGYASKRENITIKIVTSEGEIDILCTQSKEDSELSKVISIDDSEL